MVKDQSRQQFVDVMQNQPILAYANSRQLTLMRVPDLWVLNKKLAYGNATINTGRNEDSLSGKDPKGFAANMDLHGNVDRC